ncbi:hypothetical protein NOF04DRAFT_1338029 [Fusarium oxysporum II5]|nr:hypothetical protein NOF04DRAFT_1338029 [Fusarium oxysporum II5]
MKATRPSFSYCLRELLLERGADVNAQGGKCGTALQAASSGGHETIVQLLLERDYRSANARQRCRRQRPRWTLSYSTTSSIT